MAQTHAFTGFMYGGQTSAFETAATRSTVLSRVQTGSFTTDNGSIHEYGSGEGLNLVRSYYGPYGVAIRANFNVNSFDFFKHFIGPKTGAGTAGDPYDYTEATSIALNTSNLQPFSMEILNTSGANDEVSLAIGCIGQSFTLSGSVGGIVNANVSIFGRSDTRPASATSYSASTAKSYLMIGGTYKWGSSPTTLTGFRSFTLTHAYNMVPGDYRNADSRFISMPTISTRSYTGSFTVVTTKAQADILYADFYGQAVTSGPVTGATDPAFASGLEFTIDLASDAKRATISLDNCVIDSIDKPVDIGSTLSLMTVNFTAQEGASNIPIMEWTV